MIKIALTLPIQVCLWVFGVLILVALTTFILNRTGRGGPETDIAGGVALVFAGLMALLLAVGLFPYQSEYWYLYEVDTTVDEVFNGDLHPVVKLGGLELPVRVSDPRVKYLEGEEVVFTCTKSWHYQAADTFSCEIGSVKP